MKKYAVLVDTIEVHTRTYFIMADTEEDAEEQVRDDTEGIDGALREGLPYDDQYQGLYDHDEDEAYASFAVIEVEEVTIAPDTENTEATAAKGAEGSRAGQ